MLQRDTDKCLSPHARGAECSLAEELCFFKRYFIDNAMISMLCNSPKDIFFDYREGIEVTMQNSFAIVLLSELISTLLAMRLNLLGIYRRSLRNVDP